MAVTLPPPGPWPLQEWYALVDAHFAARQAAAGVRAQLDERAAQMRSIQKRLLVRFRVGRARLLSPGPCCSAGASPPVGPCLQPPLH